MPRLALLRQNLRYFSVAAALMLLGGQLTAALHFALVPHSRCAQHGELVHGNTPHEHTFHDTPSVTASALHHHDDHCQVLAITVSAAPPATHAAVAAVSFESIPSAPAPGPLGSATSILRRAPKNSPPV